MGVCALQVPKVEDESQLIAAVNHNASSYLFVENARALYYHQNLFTVYVHLPAGVVLPKDSIFRGREIDKRWVAALRLVS